MLVEVQFEGEEVAGVVDETLVADLGVVVQLEGG